MSDSPVEVQHEEFAKAHDSLVDPWHENAPVPLDGYFERSDFPPWLTILGSLIVGFLLFQAISTVATLILVVFVNGVALEELTVNMESVLRDNAGELIISNTIGQVFGLLIPAILFARLNSSKPFGFLRLRGADVRLVGLSIIGLIALIPIVQWVGGFSDALPWPQGIRDFEKAQMDMIENILNQNFSVLFAVSMMALTPAICEEVLFRGYVQRQAERVMGVSRGILFSGLIFGLYHIRPTQALPLGLLGVYLAYLTWRSGSLLPAIIVHLANNSFAIGVGKYMQNKGDTSIDLESIQVPFVVVIPAIAVLVVVTYIFHGLASRKSEGEPEEYISRTMGSQQ